MTGRILSAEINLLGGVMSGTMHFGAGLNIISGENGTLKTRLLSSIKDESTTVAINGKKPRMMAISPKRNSERRSFEQAINHFRQNNRTLSSEIADKLGQNINNNGFSNYNSIGDLFYLKYSEKSKAGGNLTGYMNEVTDEFNEFISKVFSNYLIKSEWNEESGLPRITIVKNGNIEVPIDGLSLGEQEVLSLIATINTSADAIDTFLIDEPEVHLNWSLEDALFGYLNELCISQKKQAIVVTHSRVMFQPRFIDKVQFLYWTEDGKISWGKELSASLRNTLAGDAMQLIALGAFDMPTFFVEDSSHERVILAMADSLDAKIRVSQCGNGPNVKSLYRHQRSTGALEGMYFVVDGDNKEDDLKDADNFIQLDSYCIENSFLDPERLSEISGKPANEVREAIAKIISGKKNTIIKGNKFASFLGFLLDKIDPTNLTFDRLKVFDGSQIIQPLSQALGLKSEADLMEKYLDMSQERMAAYFPEALIGSISIAPKSSPKNESDAK